MTLRGGNVVCQVLAITYVILAYSKQIAKSRTSALVFGGLATEYEQLNVLFDNGLSRCDL